MIAQRSDPPEALQYVTDNDRSDLIAAMAEIGARITMDGVTCVSLSAPDAPGTIRSLKHQGRIVLALAAISQKALRMAALAAGADEFLVTNPIEPAQLVARFEFLMHGSALPEHIVLDDKNSLALDGRHHLLSTREAALVGALRDARGGFVTHDALMALLWDGRYSDRQHLRVAINRLRRRIEPEPDLPRYLLSEPAIGYRLGTGRVVADNADG